MGHQDPTPLETKVMHGFVHGTALDLRPEGWTAPLPPAPGWDSERQVRSEVLVQLLTGMHRPDRAGVPALRLAGIAGLRLVGCRLPGLQAANLRVRADLMLDGSCACSAATASPLPVGCGCAARTCRSR